MTDKDKAAIDHIASVSKHPHAAMIVKWLITGWEVKLGGKVTNNPYWHRDFEYELIEPQPAKPAYRVYKNKRNEHTFTIDKIGGLISSKLPNDDDAILIHDWIEYDQPKKWPTPLVERIAAIDLDAAQWIVDNWDELLNDRYLECFGVSMESDRLKTMFAWSSSPQGKEYWYAISKQLGES